MISIKGIKTLFKANKLDEVLECLEKHPQKIGDQDFQNAIILLSNRYNSLKEKQRKGIAESEAELNKFKESLLYQINEIYDKDIEQKIGEEDATEENDTIHKISSLLNINKEASLLAFHLTGNDYEWRTSTFLQKRTGWSDEKINSLIIGAPKIFKRSINKTKGVIYKIDSISRLKINEIKKD